MDDWIFKLFGILGVAFYLGAYGALMAGVIRGAGYLYAALNLIAAMLVLISLSVDFNLASAIIQISFVAISLFGIIRRYILHRRIRFSLEEEELRSIIFADLSTPAARLFFDRGVWIDGKPNMKLTVQDAPVETLYYLTDGTASVIVDDEVVATVKRGFIGEIGAIEKKPAIASVALTEPSRLFAISGRALRQLRANSPELRGALDMALSRGVADKLSKANKRRFQEQDA